MREIGLALLAIVALCGFGGAAPQPSPSPQVPASPAAAGQPTWIGRYDGSTSCGTKPGQSVEEGRKQLEAAGVRVLDARKASDGKLHIQMCGAPSGILNAYRIEPADLSKATAAGYHSIPAPK